MIGEETLKIDASVIFRTSHIPLDKRSSRWSVIINDPFGFSVLFLFSSTLKEQRNKAWGIKSPVTNHLYSSVV